MEKSDTINFSSLEKELQAALEADRKYQKENDVNDTKITLVCLVTVLCYDFRDIVLASHLQPLDRKDISGAPRKQPWNPVPFSTKHKSASSEKPQLSEIQPRSASEFIRDWRRFAESKALQEIFRTEVGLGLLGEFLLILSQLLDVLSRTGCFGLNLSLLSQADQKTCEELFHKLQVAVGDSSDTSMVCEASLTHVEDDETDITAQLKALMGKYGIQK
uniref:Coiled-coil domain containing 103 n=1 Tax=Sinocyclocheilus rhinocerous TaxID=307959 RepID=A0A673MF01_9TELE